MNVADELISFTQLRRERSWPGWLVQAELGKPDLEKPNPKHQGQVNRFYWLQRVQAAEQSPRTAREIQRYRSLRGRRALDNPELVEAAAAIEVQVKPIPLASLQVAAILPAQL